MSHMFDFYSSERVDVTNIDDLEWMLMRMDNEIYHTNFAIGNTDNMLIFQAILDIDEEICIKSKDGINKARQKYEAWRFTDEQDDLSNRIESCLIECEKVVKDGHRVIVIHD